MTDYAPQEQMAVVIARDLGSEDRLLQVGTNMPVARAGVLLAHLTRHRDSRVVQGLSIDHFSEQTVPPDTGVLFDAREVDSGESWLRQDEVFDDARRPDVFFVGGYQIDRRGNVNLQGLKGPNQPFRLRGPGPAALASMSTTCAGYYAVLTRHDTHTFVEAVDYVTALGDPLIRHHYQLPGGGLRLVVSPLAVFAPGEDGSLGVVSIHHDVDPDDLRSATGFPVVIDGATPRTKQPTSAELSVLRDYIDPGGMLR